ncbi:MAG: hypothetical protein ABR973_08355 [Candidatus Acidiferrales bacterium]|jgi:hypothetical protein
MGFGLTATVRFKTLAVSALVLVFPIAAGAASHKFVPCKPVGAQCVGIVELYDDGVYWIANRVVKDGRETWEPIKKADCPRDQDYHERKAYAWDRKYGDYICVYDEIRERPDPATKRGKLFRYIGTHKALLASDATLFISSMADAASAVHCQHVSSSCRETNPILGPHPSSAGIYGTKLGLTAAYIGLDHWWAYEFKGHEPDTAYLFWCAWLVGQNYYGTLTNINTARGVPSAQIAVWGDDLAAARERLTAAHERLMGAVPIP